MLLSDHSGILRRCYEAKATKQEKLTRMKCTFFSPLFSALFKTCFVIFLVRTFLLLQKKIWKITTLFCHQYIAGETDKIGHGISLAMLFCWRVIWSSNGVCIAAARPRRAVCCLVHFYSKSGWRSWLHHQWCVVEKFVQYLDTHTNKWSIKYPLSSTYSWKIVVNTNVLGYLLGTSENIYILQLHACWWNTYSDSYSNILCLLCEKSAAASQRFLLFRLVFIKFFDF